MDQHAEVVTHCLFRASAGQELCAVFIPVLAEFSVLRCSNAHPGEDYPPPPSRLVGRGGGEEGGV